MFTKEQALKLALETANSKKTSMFVYTLNGNTWAFGSVSWIEGLKEEPKEKIEIKPSDL